MAINRTSLTSQSIVTDTNVVLEIVYVAPVVGAVLDPPMTPNKVFGFYDQALDAVRLFVVDDSGLRVLPVL